MNITLFTTLGCHLCEQAHALLKQSQALGQRFSIREVEISDSDDLMARYGIRIPVIKVDHHEGELGWPFDQSQLDAFLQART